MQNNQSRRKFMQTALTTATALSLADQALSQTQTTNGQGIPTRLLGNTGEQVSILCLGGWHIATASEEAESIRIMHAALDEGLSFFDNAWDYHDGGSEELMGRALADGGRRKKVFLMTKNCEQDYAGSKKDLEESLRRLRTDYLDLWQFHEMNYDSSPDWVFEKGGIKAALEAQRAGKVRYIGFTGHKDPRIHLKMIGKPYAWATAQMPINVMDAHYRSFAKKVVPVCLQKKIGVIGMKSLGGGYPKGRIPSEGGVSAHDCMHYALTQPISSLVVGITSMEDLKQALSVGRDFQPMAKARQEAILARIRNVAGDGRHEQFKSTQNFDGPHHRRQHGFAV